MNNRELWKGLRNEISAVFDMAQELKGQSKGPLYDSDEFARIARAYRTAEPRATNEDVLKCILTHFSEILRCV